jgi:hypothetical protein
MTSVLNTMKYSLNDIENIKSLENNYKLGDDIIQIINSISEKVGAPSYNKTPNFHKKKEERKKRKKNTDINDDDWEAIRNFQATEIKKKEGIERLIDSIRCELNKLSDENYSVIKSKILDLMSELMTADYKQEEKNKVVEIIFDIASNNKFYSKMYAELYKDLSYFYSCLTNVLDIQVNSYKDLFKDIETCNADEDYEKYCRNNKLNESRKAMTTFIVNLFKIDIIQPEVVYDMIEFLKEITRNSLNNETKKAAICEIAENLFILITETKNKIKELSNDNYEEIYEFVKDMKLLKAKDKLGLSNKAVFKYMDIYDNLNKS